MLRSQLEFQLKFVYLLVFRFELELWFELVLVFRSQLEFQLKFVYLLEFQLEYLLLFDLVFEPCIVTGKQIGRAHV